MNEFLKLTESNIYEAIKKIKSADAKLLQDLVDGLMQSTSADADADVKFDPFWIALHEDVSSIAQEFILAVTEKIPGSLEALTTAIKQHKVPYNQQRDFCMALDDNNLDTAENLLPIINSCSHSFYIGPYEISYTYVNILHHLAMVNRNTPTPTNKILKDEGQTKLSDRNLGQIERILKVLATKPDFETAISMPCGKSDYLRPVLCLPCAYILNDKENLQSIIAIWMTVHPKISLNPTLDSKLIDYLHIDPARYPQLEEIFDALFEPEYFSKQIIKCADIKSMMECVSSFTDLQIDDNLYTQYYNWLKDRMSPELFAKVSCFKDLASKAPTHKLFDMFFSTYFRLRNGNAENIILENVIKDIDSLFNKLQFLINGDADNLAIKNAAGLTISGRTNEFMQKIDENVHTIPMPEIYVAVKIRMQERLASLATKPSQSLKLRKM